MNQPVAEDRITDERVRRAVAVICSEIVFVIIPIGITAFVFLRGNLGWHELRESPEWAFAAVILAGQTSMKLIVGSSGLNKSKMQFVGVVVLLVVIAAVLVLFSILEEVELYKKPPALWLCMTQLVLFVVSAAAFLFFGVLAHVIADE